MQWDFTKDLSPVLLAEQSVLWGELNSCQSKTNCGNLWQRQHLVIIVALITLSSSLQTIFVFATTVQKFSLNDISANIQNISPSDNGCYIRDIPVNITVHFSGYSRYKPLIPYQEINCLYRVDNGEWQNASLFSASDQKYYGSPANRVNVNYVDCYYNATLRGLSNGAHFLDIDLKPDIDNHVRTSSNGTRSVPNIPVEPGLHQKMHQSHSTYSATTMNQL